MVGADPFHVTAAEMKAAVPDMFLWIDFVRGRERVSVVWLCVVCCVLCIAEKYVVRWLCGHWKWPVEVAVVVAGKPYLIILPRPLDPSRLFFNKGVHASATCRADAAAARRRCTGRERRRGEGERGGRGSIVFVGKHGADLSSAAIDFSVVVVDRDRGKHPQPPGALGKSDRSFSFNCHFNCHFCLFVCLLVCLRVVLRVVLRFGFFVFVGGSPL
jgi:hypothetical protein